VAIVLTGSPLEMHAPRQVLRLASRRGGRFHCLLAPANVMTDIYRGPSYVNFG
jgi:hypothetical protein